VGKIRTALTGLHGVVQGASRHYGVPSVSLWPCVLQRYLIDRFSVTELRAYAPFVDDVVRTLPVVISKQASLAKLARVNSRSNQGQTEDKETFYEICRANGIPHPRVCAVLGVGQANWREDLPVHFVSKDRDGAYASGFATFERIGADHVSVNGRSPQRLDEVLDRLAGGEQSLLLQERLFDHDALRALSAKPVLQTMRVNTFRQSDGRCRLLFWMIKLVVGENFSDNFSGGRTGNLIAFGNPDDGRLLGARTLHPSGVGLTTIRHHPETNRPFAGCSVPLWSEAVDAALKAHRHFPDFRALGWDVAITPEGPKILEANAWWDPPTYAPQIMSAEDWREIFG
jgi:hypothetical protein